MNVDLLPIGVYSIGANKLLYSYIPKYIFFG